MFPDDGQPSMQSLLAQASQMQQQLVAAQEQLAEARIEGTAGGGVVTAVTTGTGELVALTIDKSVCDPDDTETLADLVLAAVRDASANAAAQAAEQMGGLTAGFGIEPGPEQRRIGF